MDEYLPLEGVDASCSELLSPFIQHMMIADELIEKIALVFVVIADSHSAYGNQHKRILNIIQHSLVDFKDKPYRYKFYLIVLINNKYRTLTELFYAYRGSKTIPADVYDQVNEARKRRPEVLAFCQRVFIRLRKSLYGEFIPAYGGDFKQLAKKRKMDVVSPPAEQKKPEENVVTVASMFEQEASERSRLISILSLNLNLNQWV